MVARRRVPDSGELIWLSFEPQAGREQAGRRPALVLSPSNYNHASGLALVCPVASRAKGYPFEVALPQGAPVSGVILVDHIKSLDWRARNAGPIGRVPPEVLAEVQDRLASLIGL